MTDVALTSKQALRYVAEESGSHDATPAILRDTARGWDNDATRAERLAQGTRSKRRNVKLLREANQLRGHANLLRLAAEEIERVGAATVGGAKRNWFERFCRNLKRAPAKRTEQAT
jgi:hypothetical protein